MLAELGVEPEDATKMLFRRVARLLGRNAED
jgi:hypothetical protein